MNNRSAYISAQIQRKDSAMRSTHKTRATHSGRASLTALLTLAALMSGCKVGPNYTAPETQVPAGWIDNKTQAEKPAAVKVNLTEWWTIFNDPQLTYLINEAFKANLDVRIAKARIRQARGNYGIAVSGIGPSVNAGSDYQRGQNGTGPVTSQYQAGFDAGWEIDIFGGVQRNIESAEAQLQASVENLRDVQVTLAAEVARYYVEMRTLQQRIVITKQNLEAQKRSAEVTRKKFEGGFVSGLDVANAQAQVATTTAQIPLLESTSRQAMYALSVLIDREPSALIDYLSKTAPIPSAPPAVPVGVPSDLLLRRPDIRMAEQNIHAATANIGVATADLFPKFSIGGSYGWQTSDLNSFFNPASRLWSFGPSMSWNLFESGATLSNIDVQKAITDETLLAYRQTVLTAIQEVEKALIQSKMEQEHLKSLTEAVTQNQKAVDISTRLYAEGHTDFLNVLSAQQALFATESSMVQSSGNVSLYLISLYKALGGGWDENASLNDMVKN